MGRRLRTDHLERPPATRCGLGIGFVPLDCLLQPVFQRRTGAEPDRVPRAAYVEAAAGLAIRFARIPDDLPVEARKAGDELREVLDGDLAAAAQVDGLGRVVALHRRDQPFGAVVDVKELAADLPR